MEGFVAQILPDGKWGVFHSGKLIATTRSENEVDLILKRLKGKKI